jgi:ubiquinone/menaquinone biosynthesis C-methylase UbiE
MTPILTHEEARKFYDRFGSSQDLQFYENKAVEDLISHGEFAKARYVFEFGFGTGRLAEELLKKHLPGDCRYLGVDSSSTMVELARTRLEPWHERTEVILTDGSPKLDLPDSSFDRFVSAYVLDLLSEKDIVTVIEEAHRILMPMGQLCLAGLTYGKGPFGGMVTWLWERVHSIRPTLVGGCRPINTLDYLPPDRWRVTHHNVITTFGISSEVVVASRIDTTTL